MLYYAPGITVNTSLQILVTYFSGLTDAAVHIKDSSLAKIVDFFASVDWLHTPKYYGGVLCVRRKEMGGKEIVRDRKQDK